MRLLPEYIKARSKVIFLFLALEVIFIVTDVLFGMRSIIVIYPVFLSLAVLLIAGVADMLLFCRRHNMLEREELPEAKSLIEEDYRKIIEKLKEEAEMSRLNSSSEYNNMVEYYTVWAHQIKTPIAAMRLNLQAEDSENSRKLMGDLNRVESYVEMVLTFLRLDSNSTDYLIKEYDLDVIIRPAVRKFSREFILKRLSLEYEGVNFKTITDSKWLSFIVEQVISNAVKYTSEGKISIYMNEPGILCIEDTGIGIAAEDLPRIFENGYTGFNGREDKRASGIGLYLCKRIADDLGHNISAESSPGKGTKISIDVRRRDLRVE